MIVGPPSTNKSPSMDAVRDGLAPIEQEMFAAFEEATKEYEEAKAVAAAAKKVEDEVERCHEGC